MPSIETERSNCPAIKKRYGQKKGRPRPPLVVVLENYLIKLAVPASAVSTPVTRLITV